MSRFRFEDQLFYYISNMKASILGQPLNLGGVSTVSGGTGGPPGGFVGYLPQTRVAYDTSEAATTDTATSGSLLDNLNHIRYDIAAIPSGHTIKDSTNTFPARTNLTFIGENITVADVSGTDSTTVTISGDGTYLRLDAANSPITGALILEDKLTTEAGRIVNTTRVTTTYTVLVTDHVIFCDTDGGAFTITLPAGVEGQSFRIINCGSGGNYLTIDGNGAEEIHQELTQNLSDSEVLDLVYNSVEGWF